MNAQAQDPTIQSPFAPECSAGDQWDVSGSEIEAMCRKAARGAGYPWGLAEEAGRATRRLATWDTEAPRRMLDVLRRVDGCVGEHAPDCSTEVWRSLQSPMCPICAGVALSDRAHELGIGSSVILDDLVSPALLLPFLWQTAIDLYSTLAMTATDFEVLCTAEGMAWQSPRQPPDRSIVSTLTVSLVPTTDVALSPRHSGRCRVDVSIWRALDRLALRTCVPASETSRTGAGAGALDND